VPLSAAWVAVHYVDTSRGEGSSGIAGTHAIPYQCLWGQLAIGTGRLVHQLSGTFNATTFQDFLEKLLSFRKRDRILCLVLDDSRYHHAKMPEPWLEKHKEELILEFLPPYSPQLNPIERVWKETRKEVV